MLQSLFYLTIALRVSGFIITHHQEHKTTVTTASGNHYTVLLSAAIVEKLEIALSLALFFGFSYRFVYMLEHEYYSNLEKQDD
jgi:hypothetical protein